MTKEQMIEKIRKIVIVANNPECKSYDEALMHDIRFNKQECEVLLKETNQIIKWYDIFKTTIFDYELIGQPLTLERILVALKMYKNIQPLISYDKNNLMSISIIKEQAISEIIRIGIISNHLFSWQPNQTLDNQSKEIIEAVYNILCND